MSGECIGPTPLCTSGPPINVALLQIRLGERNYRRGCFVELGIFDEFQFGTQIGYHAVTYAAFDICRHEWQTFRIRFVNENSNSTYLRNF